MKNYDKKFIIDLYENGGRLTERKNKDSYREIIIQEPVSVNAEGSARVKIGKTEVIVGVKLNTAEPYQDTPDEGVMMVTAEFSPIADPEFEPGPPKEEAIELARVVDRTIRESHAIDTKKLCIKKGEKVWRVFIDIYIINNDGNLIDASVLGAMAALKKAKIPKLDKDGNVLFKEHTKKNVPLNATPTACTIFKLDNVLLIDAEKREEELIDARITLGCFGEYVHSMQKGGKGAFTPEEFNKCVKLAIKKNKELQKILSKF